jgi:hypothetical protein
MDINKWELGRIILEEKQTEEAKEWRQTRRRCDQENSPHLVQIDQGHRRVCCWRRTTEKVKKQG